MNCRRSVLLGLFLSMVIVLVGARWEESQDVERMSEAASSFLEALTEDQRSLMSFDFKDEERMRFHFVPVEMFERRGVMIADLNQNQRARAYDLLKSGLSQQGYMTVTQVMELEDVLLALEGGQRFARDRDEYLFSVFGKPSNDGDWGWRFEGHHISLHYTIVGGEIALVAPAFLGANPAEVKGGVQAGRRVLGDREDAGRNLVRALNPSQQRKAVIDVIAPRDILTSADLNIRPFEPIGIQVSDLGESQRRMLFELVDVYLSVVSDEIAEHRRSRLLGSDTGGIRFAWAGSIEPGQPHYYRVQGATFLIEYDNTQNGANHIHSVWREFDGDFGRDFLREHRNTVPHQ